MSSISIEQIRPKSGSTITLNGNINITGDLNGYPFGSFTGNTSGSCIPELYVENINDCGSGININDDVYLDGDVTATAYYGDSSNMTKEITGVIPVGSGITSVNSYLEYGFNLISTADTANYCVRLPQTPIQGREVSVVNNSGFDIYVFPSMSGGSINGTVNGNSVIPSDGKLYNFFCYENPNPGAWSGNIAPLAAGVYDSGIISIDTTNAPNNGYGFAYVSAYDDNFKNTAPGAATGNIIDSLNYSPIQYVPNPASCGVSSGICSMVYFKPAVNWNFIDKITVYTNFSTSSTMGGGFGLAYSSEYVYYSAGTNVWVNSKNILGTSGTQDGGPGYELADQQLAGTPTAFNGYTLTPGEPGTWFGELIYSSSTRPSQIGIFLLSSGTMNTGNNYFNGQPTGINNVDYYFIKYISFWFQTYRYSPDVKFQFLIEYS